MTKNQTPTPKVQLILNKIKELELAMYDSPKLTTEELEVIEFALVDLIKTMSPIN